MWNKKIERVRELRVIFRLRVFWKTIRYYLGTRTFDWPEWWKCPRRMIVKIKQKMSGRSFSEICSRHWSLTESLRVVTKRTLSQRTTKGLRNIFHLLDKFLLGLVKLLTACFRSTHVERRSEMLFTRKEKKKSYFLKSLIIKTSTMSSWRKPWSAIIYWLRSKSKCNDSLEEMLVIRHKQEISSK